MNKMHKRNCYFSLPFFETNAMKKFLLLVALFFLFTSFTKKEITWVAIGDSITYLNDHQNETGNRITKGYMTRVVEKLPNIHFIN